MNQTQSHDVLWDSEEAGAGVQKPTGHGERLSMLTAMTKSGWIPGAKLTWKRTRNPGADHGHMEHDRFTQGCTAQGLPNMPRPALIIMDHASYHHALSRHAAPPATGKKDSLGAGLRNKGSPVRDDGLKAAWVDMLATLAPPPTDARDELAAAQGHERGRTPPYPPARHPMETGGAVVKNPMARTCKCTRAPRFEPLDEAFESVTDDTCSGLINHVRKGEDNFWTEAARLDRRQ